MKNRFIQWGILSIFCFCGLSHLSAQCSEPVPTWVDTTKDRDNFVYAYGIGYGNSEQDAKIMAENDGQKNFIRKLTGIEFEEQPTSDTLRSIIERHTIRFASGRPYSVKTNNQTKVYILYIASQYPKEQQQLDEIPIDNTFDRRCEEYYKCINPPLPPKQQIGMPIGLKQLKSDCTFDKVRGGVWLAVQIGGFVGGIVYGFKWNTACDDYKTFLNQYNDEPYLDKRNEILNKMNEADKNKDSFRCNFWLSLGIMAGSYGINVLDNLLWTKNNKQAKNKNLYIMPNITTQYNGISFTYNF